MRPRAAVNRPSRDGPWRANAYRSPQTEAPNSLPRAGRHRADPALPAAGHVQPVQVATPEPLAASLVDGHHAVLPGGPQVRIEGVLGGGDRGVGHDGSRPAARDGASPPRLAATTSGRPRGRSRSPRSDRHARGVSPAAGGAAASARASAAVRSVVRERMLRNSLPHRSSPSLTPAPLPSIINLMEAVTGNPLSSLARRAAAALRRPWVAPALLLAVAVVVGSRGLRVCQQRQRRRGPQGGGGPGPVPDADLHRAAREPGGTGERAVAGPAGRRGRVRAPGHPRPAAAPLGPGVGQAHAPGGGRAASGTGRAHPAAAPSAARQRAGRAGQPRGAGPGQPPLPQDRRPPRPGGRRRRGRQQRRRHQDRGRDGRRDRVRGGDARAGPARARAPAPDAARRRDERGGARGDTRERGAVPLRDRPRAGPDLHDRRRRAVRLHERAHRRVSRRPARRRCRPVAGPSPPGRHAARAVDVVERHARGGAGRGRVPHAGRGR